MNEIRNIITERVDDIPLLLGQMQRMGLPTLLKDKIVCSWLFAIIWAESKSLHNRLISFFSGCVHFAIQRPGVESA